MTSRRDLSPICFACMLWGQLSLAVQADLYVSASSREITPTQPVALAGQFHLRISQKTETPLTANVIVLESRRGDTPHDCAILVSCDVVAIPTDVLELVRSHVQQQSPDLDASKIILCGTHTHTAPELRVGNYELPPDAPMSVEQYREFFARRVAEAIVEAWRARVPGSVSWGLSHAVVAYNRRAIYADGSAKMYGPTTGPEFRGLEGYEDHDVGTLWVWNATGKLLALAVNVSCPSQEVESRTAIHADFWHPVRERLRAQYGDHLCVLGLTGAAGDQSPHLMYRKAADERMRRLRGLSRLEEIARRITRAIDEAYEAVATDRQSDTPLMHQVQTIRLPMRIVSEAEYDEAKVEVARAVEEMEKDPRAADRLYRRMKWYAKTVHRYEAQQSDPHPLFEMELHAVRIGDAVICTNPFELFTEFGIRIKARSPAAQTFVIQLVGPGGYLPTQKAVRGGHYSAIVHSSLVGPEGGQVLVDRTVGLIDSMWHVDQ